MDLTALFISILIAAWFVCGINAARRLDRFYRGQGEQFYDTYALQIAQGNACVFFLGPVGLLGVHFLLRTRTELDFNPAGKAGVLERKVQLLVTKTDFCVPNLEQELRDIGVDYQIQYLENHPELVRAYNIRHSPNIVVDGKLVFRRQPSESELRAYFAAAGIV